MPTKSSKTSDMKSGENIPSSQAKEFVYYGYDITTNPFGPDFATDPYIKFDNKGNIIETHGTPHEHATIMDRIRTEKLFPFNKTKKSKDLPTQNIPSSPDKILAMDVNILSSAIDYHKGQRGISETIMEFAKRKWGIEKGQGGYPDATIEAAVKRYEYLSSDEYQNKQTKENFIKWQEGRKKKKKKSYYKPVAGRKKLSPGKKARAENQGSTEFEREIIQLIDYLMQGQEDSYHAFRSPASKTPVDVWRIDQVYKQHNVSRVKCYQCKTTRDTSPPKIVKKEFDEFVKFVNKIGAEGFWADRWKKNKNVYIRRIRGVHRDGSFYGIIYEDFSYALKKSQRGP